MITAYMTRDLVELNYGLGIMVQAGACCLTESEFGGFEPAQDLPMRSFRDHERGEATRDRRVWKKHMGENRTEGIRNQTMKSFKFQQIMLGHWANLAYACGLSLPTLRSISADQIWMAFRRKSRPSFPTAIFHRLSPLSLSSFCVPRNTPVINAINLRTMFHGADGRRQNCSTTSEQTGCSASAF
jgi:hypothetical protein